MPVHELAAYISENFSLNITSNNRKTDVNLVGLVNIF